MSAKSQQSVIELKPDQIDEGGRVLARAFQQDPLSRYVIPDDDERTRVLPLYFRTIIRSGLLIGKVWTTPRIEGVAVWWSVYSNLTGEKMREAGFGQNTSLMGDEALQRLRRVSSHEWQVHERTIQADHWYLLQLGVEPSLQGRGIGGALIAPMLKRADGENVACFVETEQPRNVPFYRRHGFELTVEDTEPISGVRFWSFLRRPRVPTS